MKKKDSMNPAFFCRERALLAFAAAFSLLFLAACQKEEIRSYSVPKTATRSDSRPATVHWTSPSGWSEQAAGGMRVGSFSVNGKDGQAADVSIIPMAGGSGSEADNANRWRSQIGLQPLGDDQLAGVKQPAPIGDAQGSLFDMAGTDPKTKQPTRILAAMTSKGGTTWFFKMIGADTLVAEQKPAFLEFLKSITFDAGVSQQTASAPLSSLPAVQATSEPAGNKPVWEIPHGWQEQPPGMMLLAKFSISDPQAGNADATVSSLEGEAGGLLANVNRWRGQVELNPVDPAQLTNLTQPIEVNGQKGSIVDLFNDNCSKPSNRIVAVTVPHLGRTWFFKLAGQNSAVEKQKPAFLKFLQSVRFPNVA